jgi:hypothetical protein
MISRRSLVAGLGVAAAAPALARPAMAQHAGHDPVYSNLTDPNVKQRRLTP